MTDASNTVRLERQMATEQNDEGNAAPSHFNDNLLQVDPAMAEFASIMIMTMGKRQIVLQLLADWWRKALAGQSNGLLARSQVATLANDEEIRGQQCGIHLGETTARDASDVIVS